MIRVLASILIEFFYIFYLGLFQVEVLINHVVLVGAFFNLLGILLVNMAVDLDVHSFRAVDHHFLEKVVDFCGGNTLKFLDNIISLVEGKNFFHQHLLSSLVFLSKIFVFLFEVVDLRESNVFNDVSREASLLIDRLDEFVYSPFEIVSSIVTRLYEEVDSDDFV